MHSPLENLCSPGSHEIRNLGEYEGDLNVDERIVRDLITASQKVAAQLNALPPITEE